MGVWVRSKRRTSVLNVPTKKNYMYSLDELKARNNHWSFTHMNTDTRNETLEQTRKKLATSYMEAYEALQTAKSKLNDAARERDQCLATFNNREEELKKAACVGCNMPRRVIKTTAGTLILLEHITLNDKKSRIRITVLEVEEA